MGREGARCRTSPANKTQRHGALYTGESAIYKGDCAIHKGECAIYKGECATQGAAVCSHRRVAACQMDPKTGRPYYVHSASGKTQWEKPQDVLDMVEVTSAMRPVSPLRGRSATCKAPVLSRGTGAPIGATTSAPARKRSHTPERRPRSATSTAGNGAWKKMTDPKTGRAYYYNQSTRETSWVDPTTQPTGH